MSVPLAAQAADDLEAAFELDLQVITASTGSSEAARCGSGDNCGSTCASACSSLVEP